MAQTDYPDEEKNSKTRQMFKLMMTNYNDDVDVLCLIEMNNFFHTTERKKEKKSTKKMKIIKKEKYNAKF